jgi:hypothetical protein
MTRDDSRNTQTNAGTTPDVHDDILARALARFGRRMRQARAADAEPIESMSAPAFRMLVAERLRALERDVAEVRARINGLLFVVAGAVVTQLVLRLTT